jgi:hypothetical protein
MFRNICLLWLANLSVWILKLSFLMALGKLSLFANWEWVRSSPFVTLGERHDRHAYTFTFHSLNQDNDMNFLVESYSQALKIQSSNLFWYRNSSGFFNDIFIEIFLTFEFYVFVDNIMQCVSNHLLAVHFLINCQCSTKTTLNESEQVLCRNWTADSTCSQARCNRLHGRGVRVDDF